MRMRSRIKYIFKPKLLERLAAVCDTNMIENNQLKMDLVQRLLNREGIKTSALGGATNRYAFIVEGYAVKVALDDQGYKDNLMEFSLTQEMPDTQDSYETNGYVLVQELGRNLSIEEWVLHKHDILRKLDNLGKDYLLGDVGYFDVNITNWVMSDNGEVQICDYAYCHRLTENLFTCPMCGSILAYDECFVNVLCTDRANCHEKYSYNDIKAIQGDKVDWDMIHEALASSVKIPEGEMYVDVDVDGGDMSGNVFIVRSYRDMYLYNMLKEEREAMTEINYNNPEVSDLLKKLLMAKIVGDKPRVSEIEGTLSKMEKPVIPIPECVIDPEFQERIERDRLATEEAKLYDTGNHDDYYEGDSITSLINRARKAQGIDDNEEIEYFDEEDAEEEQESMPNDDESSIKVTSDSLPLSEDVVLDGNSIRDMVIAGA